MHDACQGAYHVPVACKSRARVYAAYAGGCVSEVQPGGAYPTPFNLGFGILIPALYHRGYLRPRGVDMDPHPLLDFLYAKQ